MYGKQWRQLNPEQQQQIQVQIDAIVAQAGWETEAAGEEVTYIKPLTVDVEGAKRRLGQYLNDYDGRPIPIRTSLSAV